MSVPKEIEEGEILFSNFVKDRLKSEGITQDLDSYLVPVGASFASLPSAYKNPHIIECGTKLQKINKNFAEDHEKKVIEQKAKNVNVENLEKEKYFELLREIFKKDFKVIDIWKLFLFCADLIIRRAMEGVKEACNNIYSWTLEFITQNISPWVADHGGWVKLVNDMLASSYYTVGYYYNYYIIGALIILVAVSCYEVFTRLMS